MFFKQNFIKVSLLSISFFTLSISSAYSKDYYYKFNNKDSKINFELSTNVHPVKADVEKFKGSITVKSSDDKNITSVNGILEIDTTSINTNIALCDVRIQKETLNTSKYPKITFKVSDTEVISNKIAIDNTIDLKLLGTLMIRDTSKKVEIPVKATLSADKNSAIVEGKYKINFNDYNIPDPSVLIAKVNPIIELSFKLKVR
jgi:polyisoprenoid-binding protein YceI